MDEPIPLLVLVALIKLLELVSDKCSKIFPLDTNLIYFECVLKVTDSTILSHLLKCSLCSILNLSPSPLFDYNLLSFLL